MNKQSLLPIIMLAAYIAWQHFAGGGSPIAPKPAPTLGSEVLAAFSQTDHPVDASLHAKALADICVVMAEVLDRDGKAPKPRLDTGVKIDDYRRLVREWDMSGKSLGTAYPQLTTVCKAHFEGYVGTSGGPIDEAQRQKWIQAFGVLAKASYYASEEL